MTDRTAAVVALWLLAAGSASADYEKDVQSFPVRHTVPAKWLHSSDYRIDPDVLNKDFMNHYRVTSGFGTFPARGNSRLYVRIREISALARLEEMSKSKLFVDAAGDTISSTVDSVNSAIDDPSGTAKEFGSGLSRLLRRLGRMAKNTYRMGKALVFDDDQSTEEKQKELSSTGQNVAKGFLGVNRAYRELARDLGVDPYTRNGLLRAEMERMANYAAAGSFGVKTVVPVLPLLYGAGYLITVSNLVWNTHPIDLQIRNEKSLRKMGKSRRNVRRLVQSDHHTLTTQTRITQSLELMKGVKGRGVLLHYAANAATVNDALFFTRMIELLAIYHQKRGPIERVVATDRIPFATTRQGRAVLIFPVDYLRWTALAERLTEYMGDQMSHHVPNRELWVTGQVSATARIQLGGLGWALFDHAGSRI